MDGAVIFLIIWFSFFSVVLFCATSVHIVGRTQRGVLTRFGQIIGEYGPGIKVAVPFASKMALIDTQPEKAVLLDQAATTKDGQQVSVDIEVSYLITSALAYHQSPTDREAVLLMVLKAIRQVIGSHSIRLLVSNSADIEAASMEELNLRLASSGILVTQVSLDIIDMPPMIRFALAARTNAIGAVQAARMLLPPR